MDTHTLDSSNQLDPVYGDSDKHVSAFTSDRTGDTSVSLLPTVLYPQRLPDSRSDVFRPKGDYDTHSNYLGRLESLPSDVESAERRRSMVRSATAAEESESVTEEALGQLFQPHSSLSVFVGPQDGAGNNGLYDDVRVRPSTATRSPTPRRPADEHRAADAPGGPSRPAKRKATSRANMLTRGGACDFCKRRKLRCSADLPSCMECIKAGKECVYSQKKQVSKVRELEGKLNELERRLDGQANAAETDASLMHDPISLEARAAFNDLPDRPTAMRAASAALYNTVPAVAVDHSTDLWRFLHGLEPVSSSQGFRLAVGDDLSVIDDRSAFQQMDFDEPDLTPLADAAATNEDVNASNWLNMDPVSIAQEVRKAALGIDGRGKRLVKRLLRLYNRNTLLGQVMPRETLQDRLHASTDSPIHPALLLALVVALLPLSLSAGAIAQNQAESVIAQLLPTIRSHASTAASHPDDRLLDIVAAHCLIAVHHLRLGQYHPARIQANSAASLAWSCGLGRLGGVVERWVGAAPDNEKEHQRQLAMEKRRRIVYKKTALAPPPASLREYGERVDLFWVVFMLDKASSIATGQPAMIVDEEVTTPWPLAVYTKVARLRDGRTVWNFLGSGDWSLREDAEQTPVSSPVDDSPACRSLKSLSILHNAVRLLDQKHTAYGKASEAGVVALTYRGPLEVPDALGTLGMSAESRNDVLALCGAARVFQLAREGTDDAARVNVDGLRQTVTEAAAFARLMTDGESAFTPSLDWLFCIVISQIGAFAIRAFRHLDMRPEVAGTDLAVRFLNVGKELRRVLENMGTTLPAATEQALMLERLSSGTELQENEYHRPDNLV